MPTPPPEWNPTLVRGRPPTLGDPRLFPNRRRSGLRPAERLALQVERDALFHRLDQLDRAMVDGAHERREILDQLTGRRDQLWPRIPWQRGRRPSATFHAPLPPAAATAAPLSGLTLRQTCLAILARHGSLPLVELHAWLHRYGYLVDGAHPVKALADALGHEHDAGRAERTSRGTYRLAPDRPLPPGWPTDPTPAGDPSTVTDPLTDPPLRHCRCGGPGAAPPDGGAPPPPPPTPPPPARRPQGQTATPRAPQHP